MGAAIFKIAFHTTIIVWNEFGVKHYLIKNGIKVRKIPIPRHSVLKTIVYGPSRRSNGWCTSVQYTSPRILGFFAILSRFFGKFEGLTSY